MPEDRLINVFGCPRCKKLAGDITEKRVVQGYEQCPECYGDLDYFWLNMTKMKFQESRQVPIEEVNRLADEIGGDFGVAVKPAQDQAQATAKLWWKRS